MIFETEATELNKQIEMVYPFIFSMSCWCEHKEFDPISLVGNRKKKYAHVEK